MKFSITHLEQARQDPAEFAKSLKEGESSESKFSGPPKSMRWLSGLASFTKAESWLMLLIQ